MGGSFAPGVGVVFSADIAVPDHERELRFYSRSLTSGESPLWREDLMNREGMPIIGLGARSAAHDQLPIQWMPHIQGADVAASAQRAIDRGGRELMHARDSAGTSQWAVLVDPNGAAFGIIPVVPAEHMPPDSAPSSGDAPAAGRLAWLDLTVSDAIATRDFYQQVVGWSVQEVEVKDGDERYADFNMLAEDGNPAAGICHARGTNAGLPPVWMIYLPVGDLDESLSAVQEEGGSVVKATRGRSGEYLYAVVQDPVGASFALLPS